MSKGDWQRTFEKAFSVPKSAIEAAAERGSFSVVPNWVFGEISSLERIKTDMDVLIAKLDRLEPYVRRVVVSQDVQALLRMAMPMPVHPLLPHFGARMDVLPFVLPGFMAFEMSDGTIQIRHVETNLVAPGTGWRDERTGAWVGWP